MSLSQHKRPIAIKTPLGDNVLGLRSIVVKEQIGRPFVIEAQFSSLDPDIIFDNIVGHPVTVSLTLSAGQRYWHALVSRFSFVGRHEQYFHYQATLVPWFWALTRSSDCRIFQEQTIPDIVQKIFRDHGCSDFDLRLSGSYPTWNYCVQYRETDFNFVSRLLEQEGVAFYFKHPEDKCRLIMADDKAAYDTLADFADLYYRPDTGEERLQDTIIAWDVGREVQPTQYSLTDYNFNTPRQSMLGVAQVSRAHALNDGKIFDYPGEYTAVGDGERLAQVRLDELQVGLETARAETSCLAVSAGALFSLKEHPRSDQNREYLITSAELFIDAGEFSSDPSFVPRSEARFTAIPSEQHFRPARATPKPIVQGPQTAVVVGPSGAEIHTDSQARVKVHFHWDRHDQRNEKSSCWIRVSQPWAGKGWGSMATPRIGQEVIVEFLEGDPDRPIITGRVYNGDNAPPYAGGQGVVSGLKSQTHKGAGFNEMSLDDTAGKEKITIHGQFDMNTTVEHDQTTTVHNNRTDKVDVDDSETVGGNQTASVIGNQTESITGNQILSVAQNRTRNVTQNESVTVALMRTHTVGINEAITVGAAQEITVGAAQTISVGAVQAITVGAAQATTVGGSQANTIGSSQTNTISSNQTTSVGGDRSATIAKNDSVSAGKKITITAGDELLIKTGDASILLKKDGTIQIKGKDISIKGSGKISAKADGDIIMKGSKIAAN